MKIVFASSEIVPFASTGGLGDVCASLPKALAAEGVEVIRFMPLYQSIDREKHGIVPCEYDLHIPLSDSWYYGTVWKQVTRWPAICFQRTPARRTLPLRSRSRSAAGLR